DFSFLPEGIQFKAYIMTDGINSNKIASDYKVEQTEISSKTKRTFHMASGGGFAIALTK
ncbi:MAG: glycoside hydrolase family 97 C-terminal domain-containing protein, partial [Bacteroidaceae bacterium]|nr:glycoside hydrolase family 97 C-terminal domain-containing protein [Bacteroidaceae bacterium]